MSRTLLLGVLGLSLVPAPGAQYAANGQEKEKGKKEPAATPSLEGAWRRVGDRDPRTGKLEKQEPGIEMIKLMGGGRWGWTVTRDHRVLAALGGTYAVRDDRFSEKVDYMMTDNFEGHVGREFSYSWKIEKDVLTVTGTNVVRGRSSKVNEVWERYPRK